MFIPLGDQPNNGKTPWVVSALILTYALVFISTTLPMSLAPAELSDPNLHDYLRKVAPHLGNSQPTAYDLLAYVFGYRPANPVWWTLFTSQFLHAGWSHLLGNILFLWVFGDNVEHRLGWWRFLGVYLCCGVVSTISYATFASGTHAPLVGASGAISGILGLYLCWFPRNQVRTFVFLFPLIMQIILVPSRYLLAFYLFVDNILPFIVDPILGVGPAHGAHVGGFLVGLFLGVSSAMRGRRKRRIICLDEVDRLVRIGFPRRAVRLFYQLSETHPRTSLPGVNGEALAESLCRHGAYEDAAKVYRILAARAKNQEDKKRYKERAALSLGGRALFPSS